MSNEQDSTKPNGSPFPIPSFDEVERLRSGRTKKLPSFFKPGSASTTPPVDKVTTIAPTVSDNAAIVSTTPIRPPPSIIPKAPMAPSIQRSTTPMSRPESNLSRSSTSSPSNTKRSGGSSILVHPKQEKNPILKHIRNVYLEPSGAIKVDYVVGQTTGVLYLSLRYHQLYPNYIYERLTECKNLYVVRILLVYVDVESYHTALQEINRIAVLSEFTLILAWSMEEAGRYLETYKTFEHKGPDMIRGRVEEAYLDKVTDCLTQIKSVNKTDVLTLLSTFGSIKNISDADTVQLALCPGFGDQKVKRLQAAFTQPFLANKKR